MSTKKKVTSVEKPKKILQLNNNIRWSIKNNAVNIKFDTRQKALNKLEKELALEIYQ